MFLDCERIAACDESCLMNTIDKQLRRCGYTDDFINAELICLSDIYRKIKSDSKNSPLTFSEYSSLKSIEFTIGSCNCHKHNKGFIEKVKLQFQRIYS